MSLEFHYHYVKEIDARHQKRRGQLLLKMMHHSSQSAILRHPYSTRYVCTPQIMQCNAMQMHNNIIVCACACQSCILLNLNCLANRNTISLNSRERQHAFSSLVLSTTRNPWTAWRAHSSYRISDLICWLGTTWYSYFDSCRKCCTSCFV